mgnify:CR=1 FL=1
MSKADEVIKAAESQLGSPYVYGAWGSPCTVALRKKYARLNPNQKANTYRRCPVLSDKQATCEGCKYEGKLAFDCRGFTDWTLKTVGIDLFGDYVGRQWSEKSNWDERGDIADMPDLVCCLFVKKKDGNWSHTGLHIGGGKVIHCSVEVKYDTVTGGANKWSHYAIPKGLYTPEEIKKAHRGGIMRTLRKGSTGDDVRILQQALTDAGFKTGVDGNFGAGTEKAVKDFQKAHGLGDDGVCGPKTWKALEPFLPVQEPEAPEEPESPEDPEAPEDEETELLIMLPYSDVIALLKYSREIQKILEKALQ